MPSLITSIIGGVQGASAAKDAAKIQVAGANAAGQTVTDAANAVNPTILNAAAQAGMGVTNAAGAAGAGVVNTANDAGRDLKSTATDAGGKVIDMAQNAATGVYGAADKANAGLDPYAAAGKTSADLLNSGLAAGGDLTKNFTSADLPQDDGYNFRLAEGQKALDRSAAARGGVSGGGQMKAIAGYSQGLASDEFGKAFDRFNQNRDARFKMLSTTAGQGQQAATTQGANDTNAARYAGDVTTDASKFAGAADLNAQQHAGDMGVDASKFNGNANLNAATWTGDANIKATEAAGNNTINAAGFKAQTQIGAADADAQGHLGSANAWNGMLTGIGSAANSAIAGGFSGGAGFNWGGVLKGATPKPVVAPGRA